MVSVAIAKGDNRYQNVSRALSLVEKEVSVKIKGTVLVKPNLVVDDNSLAVTHVDAVRAVLDFVMKCHPEKILVAEASGNVSERFNIFGYRDLEKEYDVELVDLNKGEFEEFKLLTSEMTETSCKLSKIAIDADCRVSLAVPKSHSEVIATLSIKNAMGFIFGQEQWKIHGLREFGGGNLPLCVKVIHRNLVRLLKHVPFHISVLDGFTGVEGGTVPQCGRGDKVDLGLAFASADPVAVDAVAAKTIGFEPEEIGYIYYAGREGLGEDDLSKINVVGERIPEVHRAFAPPPRIEVLRAWRTGAATIALDNCKSTC